MVEIYENIDLYPEDPVIVETPVVKKKNVGRYPTPSSMAQRVKARIKGKERKGLDLTPQLNTNEIIHIHEGEDQKAEKIKGKKTTSFKLDNKFDAVCKTSDEVKKMLVDTYERDGVNESPFAHVSVRDILNILHHKTISDAVIDSWADICLLMYDQSEFAQSTKVFTTSCWDLIYKKTTSNILHSLIDEKLELVGLYDTLIFPILVK